MSRAVRKPAASGRAVTPVRPFENRSSERELHVKHRLTYISEAVPYARRNQYGLACEKGGGLSLQRDLGRSADDTHDLLDRVTVLRGAKPWSDPLLEDR